MEDPLPRRGGAVETWLKRHRDQHPAGEPSWDALNDALDDLRDRSDIGAAWTDTLDDTAGYPEVVSPPPAGDGFAWARAQLAQGQSEGGELAEWADALEANAQDMREGFEASEPDIRNAASAIRAHRCQPSAATAPQERS
jgi:hypothetical protein